MVQESTRLLTTCKKESRSKSDINCFRAKLKSVFGQKHLDFWKELSARERANRKNLSQEELKARVANRTIRAQAALTCNQTALQTCDPRNDIELICFDHRSVIGDLKSYLRMSSKKKLEYEQKMAHDADANRLITENEANPYEKERKKLTQKFLSIMVTRFKEMGMSIVYDTAASPKENVQPVPMPNPRPLKRRLR